MTTEPIAPTVHRNGTCAKDLLEGFEKTGEALRAALKALSEYGPNARDFYAQGPDAWPRAAREAEARLAKVRAVFDEIQAIHEAVANQEA